MLERLDEIDWYSLGHAYGDASNVPSMIRAVATPDEAVRESAWYALFGSVCHQGTMYSATSVVVSFLLELLEEPTILWKSELLDNLAGFSPDCEYWPHYCGEQPYDDEPSNQTRTAIAVGLPIYTELLQEADPQVRKSATRALAVCCEQRDRVARILREHYFREEDGEVRTMLSLQIGLLNRPDDSGFFAEVCSRESDPVARMAAALAWIYVGGTEPHEDCLHILEEGAKPSNDLLSKLPLYERVVDEALDALGNMGDRGIEVLLQLLHSPTIEVKKKAIQKLGRVRPFDSKAVQGMLTALSDPDPEVRQWSAFLLGHLGESTIVGGRLNSNIQAAIDLENELGRVAPEIVLGLTERLALEPEEGVRGAICRALRDLALWGTPALPALRKFAPEESFAKDAVALIEKVERGDIDELHSLAVDGVDRTSWLGSRALMRIGREYSETIIPLLVEGLGSWPNAARVSANLLGELGSAAIAAVPELRAALTHQHQSVRNAASAAILAIDPEGGDPLAVASESEIRDRLGPDAPTELVGLVAGLLDDSYQAGQLGALWKIGQLGARAKSAIPYLREAREKPWLECDAVGALARVDPELARPLLPEVLRRFEVDGLDGDTSLGIIKFCDYLGPELHVDAVAFLMGCLPEPGESPRRAAGKIPYALYHLASAGAKVLAPLTIGLLQTSWESGQGCFDANVTVLMFLKQQGAEYRDATPIVLELAKNEKYTLLALETLSRIGRWSVVVPRLDAFLARDQQVRQAAEECVARLGERATKEDVAHLRSALAHKSEVLRTAAKAALERLGLEP